MAQGTVSKSKSKSNKQATLIVGGVIAVVIIIAVVAVLLSTSGATVTSDVDYSQIPQERLADGGFILGNPEARVTIVVFEDFLCPHCQNYTRTVVHPFVEEYVATGQARFEFRMLPAVSAQLSPLVASLVECSNTLEEGSFWEAHDVMFSLTSSQSYSQQTQRTFAERMNLNYAELLSCSSEATQYQADAQLASTVNVSATPTVMIRIDGGDLQSAGKTQLSLQEIGALIQQYQ